MKNCTLSCKLCVGIVLITLMLSGCGGGMAATTEAPPAVEEPPTEEPTTEAPPTEPPTEEPVEPTPTEAAQPPPPESMELVREAILKQATNVDMAGFTLFQLMGVPLATGESVIFHYEDLVGETAVGCSGHAVITLTADGETYGLNVLTIFCGPTMVETPITIYPSDGVDASGQPVLVIYGEVYSEDVFAIRLFYSGDGTTNAVVSGGGYYAALPLDATEVTVKVYDKEGSLLYEGVPREPESE